MYICILFLGEEVKPFVEVCSMEEECFTAYSDIVKVTAPSRPSQPALE